MNIALDFALRFAYFAPPVLASAGMLDTRRAWPIMTLAAASIVVVDVTIEHSRVDAMIWAVFTGFCAHKWWNNRRKGGWKRAARQLGAKAKAAIDAMVRQLTPSPIPSPAGA